MVSLSSQIKQEQDGNGNTAIEITNFNSWYGDFQALHNINLSIPENRVTAFIGPSGCGKSTFLRWFNRMNDIIPTAHSSGSIKLHGKNIMDKKTDVVELRRKVGMVFQKPNPFPKSISANILFGPKLHRRVRKKEGDEIVEKTLKQVNLWDEVKDRLKQSALSLSGGQQQRLCIARALAIDPNILLMDEPTSALDPKSTKCIEELIQELEKNYTIVIVTHNMQQAARISDRTALFYEGELVEADKTKKIFTTPQHQQTEDYITGRFG